MSTRRSFGNRDCSLARPVKNMELCPRVAKEGAQDCEAQSSNQPILQLRISQHGILSQHGFHSWNYGVTESWEWGGHLLVREDLQESGETESFLILCHSGHKTLHRRSAPCDASS